MIIKEYRNNLVSSLSEKGAKNINDETVKTMLIIQNEDYPKDDDGKYLSTTKINNEQLLNHIEFIFKVGGKQGFKFSVVEDEWARIMQNAMA